MIDLYKNIKHRRKELGITQTELAEKTGYSNKSSIATIEAGKIDLPLSKVKEFASALDCSPEYLMGWEVPEHSVEYSSTFEDYSERVGISHSILKKFKIDVEQLVIEDLKTARTLIEKRIDLYYEDIEQQQDEIEADLALEEQRDASDFELPAGWKR